MPFPTIVGASESFEVINVKHVKEMAALKAGSFNIFFTAS